MLGNASDFSFERLSLDIAPDYEGLGDQGIDIK